MTKKMTLWNENKALFEKKMAHLNKILARLGKEPIRYRYENERGMKVTMQTHMKGDSFANDTFADVMVFVRDVVIEGEAFVKKDDRDYRYIGSVRFEGGVKQTSCRDEAYADAFINFREGICDHCGTKNRNRKAYYLFEVDGKVIQVGSTCVKEYFGIDSMRYLECMEETLSIISECEDGWLDFDGSRSFAGGFGLPYETIYGLLDFATMGFMKWTKAADGCSDVALAYGAEIHELATVEIVRNGISALFNGREPMFGENKISLTREQCIEYWKSQPLTCFTDNVLNALKAEGATDRSLGTYCYGIYGAVNAAVKAQMAKEADTSKPCRHEVGKRVNIRGKVLSIKEYEVEDTFSYRGGWITKYTVNFRDEDDALYHFNTGSTTFMNVKEGDEIEVRGKVEAAKEYKGVMYTGLNLPKCVRVVEPAA